MTGTEIGGGPDKLHHAAGHAHSRRFICIRKTVLGSQHVAAMFCQLHDLRKWPKIDQISDKSKFSLGRISCIDVFNTFWDAPVAFYIAMTNRTDLKDISEEAHKGIRPRHAIAQLAAALPARVLQPGVDRGTLIDRILAKIVGTQQTWHLARELRKSLRTDDIVFCADESIGIPIAALCGGGVKILLLGHNLDRPRIRAAFLLFSLSRKITTFMAVSRKQKTFLERYAKINESNILLMSDQTDLKFFTPGPSTPRQRPLIVSVGLEKRDYRTLAAATQTLDVDVCISGFSLDARSLRQTFPEVMPDNMSRQFYSWLELRDLYRSANVVVISLFPNTYAAGIQCLLEAIACGAPVVVTRSDGLSEYLERPDLVTSIAMGDSPAMRAAILTKLADPVASRQQALKARDFFADKINSENYISKISKAMRAIT